MDADHIFLMELEERDRRFPFPGDFERAVERGMALDGISEDERDLLEDRERHRQRR